MALDKARLKGKLKTAMQAETTEQSNPDASLDRICDAFAQAIIEEIKELTITYSSGLTAPNGAVAGMFGNTLS